MSEMISLKEIENLQVLLEKYDFSLNSILRDAKQSDRSYIRINMASDLAYIICYTRKVQKSLNSLMPIFMKIEELNNE